VIDRVQQRLVVHEGMLDQQVGERDAATHDGILLHAAFAQGLHRIWSAALQCGVDFHLKHPYDAAPDVVWAMLTDPEYLRAKLAATDALEFDLVECTATPDGGFRIVTQRTVEADIPGFAKKVFKPVNSLTQIEDWQPETDGVRQGTWRIETKGVPVSTGGTGRLEPTPIGAVQHIEGKIKVSVPLIGGRLEKFVFDQANKTMETEHDFGQKWLKDH
jgi:hypothetical protein